MSIVSLVGTKKPHYPTLEKCGCRRSKINQLLDALDPAYASDETLSINDLLE